MLNSKTDIIVTSGAVSAGKYDFIPNVIKTFRLSNYFKSVAIRPGKPVLFAKLKVNKKQSLDYQETQCLLRLVLGFVYPYISSLLNLSDERPIQAVLKIILLKRKILQGLQKVKLTQLKMEKRS